MKYTNIYLTIAIFLLNILPIYSDVTDVDKLAIEINNVSSMEDNSGYFRREVLNNLTNKQILNYLTRKETAEQYSDIKKGAIYLQGYIPPFPALDRKIDPEIGSQWKFLTVEEKNMYRLRWFKQNQDSLSIQDMQKYININELVEHARQAEYQRLDRMNLKKISLKKLPDDKKERRRIIKTKHRSLKKHQRKAKKNVTNKTEKKSSPDINKKTIKEEPETETKKNIEIIIPELKVRNPQQVELAKKTNTEKDISIESLKTKIENIKKRLKQEYLKKNNPDKSATIEYTSINKSKNTNQTQSNDNIKKLKSELEKLKNFKIGE